MKYDSVLIGIVFYVSFRAPLMVGGVCLGLENRKMIHFVSLEFLSSLSLSFPYFKLS